MRLSFSALRSAFSDLLFAMAMFVAFMLLFTAIIALSSCERVSTPQERLPQSVPAPMQVSPETQQWIDTAGIPIDARLYAREVARDAHYYWSLDAPIETFLAQIHQESGYKANAHSSYAAGLAQFTPDTARNIARMYPKDLHDANPLDPHWAIRALVIYDKNLAEHFASAATDDDVLAFALASYNGGQGWIDRERGACLALAPDCDNARYFDNVQRACGTSAPRKRSRASCKENTHYPEVILHKWRPIYQQWSALNAIN